MRMRVLLGVVDCDGGMSMLRLSMCTTELDVLCAEERSGCCLDLLLFLQFPQMLLLELIVYAGLLINVGVRLCLRHLRLQLLEFGDVGLHKGIVDSFQRLILEVDFIAG